MLRPWETKKEFKDTVWFREGCQIWGEEALAQPLPLTESDEELILPTHYLIGSCISHGIILFFFVV
jgi:hypothetical protein